MPIWKYNDKCHLEIDQANVDQYATDQPNKTQDGEIDTVEFQKNIHTLWV